MNNEINQFHDEVLQDPALLQQLESTTSRESLVNIAVELAQEKGYSFNTKQLTEWIIARQKAAEKAELNEADLESLSGGLIQLQQKDPFLRF
jgi:predicted ribosomally synthesized peptide with nif11-like leader